MVRRIPAVLLAAALIAAACSSDDDAPRATSAPDAEDAPADDRGEDDPDHDDEPDDTPEVEEPTDASPAPAALLTEIAEAVDAAPDCDPLDTRHCYLPWPSDAHTITDDTTLTGRRVALPTDGAPANGDGVVIDVTEWNRNDGFSPNTRLMTFVEGIDADASALPSWTDLGASLADDATIVMIDTSTGERIPLWAELDLDVSDDGDRTVLVHPAISLPPATEFAVALRGLVTADGSPVEPSPVFRAYRDRLTTDLDTIEDRRPEMESAFESLTAAGIDRDELQLAWTFTTASTDNVTGRMRHLRDATLAELAGSAPTFTVTDVDDDAEVDTIARVVTGVFTAPNWLTGDGGAGNGFHYGDRDPMTDPDALPVANGTVEVEFRCNVPDSVIAGSEPGRLVQYGHGLLGSEREINAGNVRAMSNEHDAVYCATKWAGMSEDDIGNAISALGDMSTFSTLADRLQQGVLHHILLGRLMIADDGLVSHPAFIRPDGAPLIDTSRVVYDGNSQGGIMGLMLVAVSPDLERAVLGVPGMNYSLLLPRSVDFDPFRAVFEPAYPDALERSIIISMIQMLWDRGEGAGYLRHVVDDPFPATPTTDVLFHVAFGDWQVTELSAFIAARTMGVPIHRPVTAPGRSAEVEPGWGIETIPSPTDEPGRGWPGSALIVWDSGSDPIPLGPTPPRTSRDSHEDPRADETVRVQKAAFLFDGELVDVCGDGLACTARPRD